MRSLRCYGPKSVSGTRRVWCCSRQPDQALARSVIPHVTSYPNPQVEPTGRQGRRAAPVQLNLPVCCSTNLSPPPRHHLCTMLYHPELRGSLPRCEPECGICACTDQSWPEGRRAGSPSKPAPRRHHWPCHRIRGKTPARPLPPRHRRVRWPIARSTAFSAVGAGLYSQPGNLSFFQSYKT